MYSGNDQSTKRRMMFLKFDGYVGLSIATLGEHPEITPLFTKKTRSVVQEAMLTLLYFSIQDNFDLRIKRTRYLIILADTYVFLAKAQRRYVFKLNAGANAKAQRRNE